MNDFNPSQTYEGLLAQAKALHRILQSKEKINIINVDKIKNLEQELLLCNQNEIQELRKVNEQLTNRIEYLERQLSNYEQARRKNPKNK